MNLIDEKDILRASNNKILGTGGAKLLMLLMKLNKVNRWYSDFSHKQGLEFIDTVFEELDFKYEVSPEDLKRIPVNGPFLTVSNHPFGGLDGLILIRILAGLRNDYKVLANFLLQRIDPIKDYFIAVNPFDDEKIKVSSMTGLKLAMGHLKEGSPLGIFPAGEVSSFYQNSKGITDKQWGYSAIKFIKKAEVPVVPIYFQGTNTLVFHLLGLIHPALRTVRLPAEFFKKKNKTIKVRIGQPISVKEQKSITDISRYGRYLRAKTYALGTTMEVKKFFRPIHHRLPKPLEVVPPVPGHLIANEVDEVRENYLLFKNNQYSVICAPSQIIPNTINEIGRLREITFREVGEGTNMKIDVDEYDLYYNQLFIWDEKKKQIVGAYRVGMGKEILDEYGIKGFYIQSLFKINKRFEHVLSNSMELGRSFIVKEYQKQPLPLFLLWKGIVYALLKSPEYRYLIGPVSISNRFSKFSRSLLIEFLKRNYYNQEFAKLIRPRKKFVVKNQKVDTKILLEEANDLKKLDNILKGIEKDDTGMPVLFKKYLGLGGKVIGFNLDPKFNNALDGLLILDIYDVPMEVVASFSKEVKDDSILDRFKLDTSKL